MVRYTNKLNNDLRRAVRNYNAKLVRLAKKNTEVKLPSKVKIRDIKKYAKTREEVRSLINDYRKFTKRGAEKPKSLDNFSVTKWEYNKVLRETKKAKKLLDLEINRLETTNPEIFGKQQATTYAKMGASAYENVKAKREKLNTNLKEIKNYSEFKKQSVFASRMSNLDKQKTTFKENYLSMLEQNAYFYSQDKEKAKEVYEYFANLDNEDFYNEFLKDKGVQATLDYYKMIHDIGSIASKNDNNLIELLKKDSDTLLDTLYERVV